VARKQPQNAECRLQNAKLEASGCGLIRASKMREEKESKFRCKLQVCKGSVGGTL
jgi:hypothetical protein